MKTKRPNAVNEAERLETLRAYQILDTPAEPGIDEIVELAGSLFNTSYAAVSLVEKDRQYFKSRIGFTEASIPRGDTFCSEAIESPEPLVVRDTLRDQRFCSHELVVNGPKIRFYAGVPLIARNGHIIGTLCVTDTVPHQVTKTQLSALSVLARQVMAQFELRLFKLESEREKELLAFYAQFVEVTEHIKTERAVIQAVIDHGLEVRHALKIRFARRVGVRVRDGEERLAITDGGDNLFGHLVVEPQFGGKLTPLERRILMKMAHRAGQAMGNVRFATQLKAEATERAMVEEELRNLNVRSEEIFSAIRSVMIVLDAQGRIVRWNEPAKHAFGVSADYAIGKELATLGLNCDYPTILDFIDRVRNTKKQVQLDDVEVRSPEGTKLLGLNMTPLTTMRGCLTGILILGADITHRRLAETRAKAQEKKYRNVIDTVRDVIFQIDMLGRWEFLNSAWETITGFPIEESIGSSVIESFITRDTGGLECEVIPLLHGERASCSYVTQIKTRGGNLCWVQLNALAVRDEDGQVTGISGTMHDITLRKYAESEAEARRDFESVVTTLSTKFINLDGAKIHLAIQEALETVAAFIGVDGCSLALLSPSGDRFRLTQQWRADGLHAIQLEKNWIPVNVIPCLSSKLKALQPVFIPDLDVLPPEELAERSIWPTFPGSMACLPLAARGQLFGMFTLSHRGAIESWPSETVALLKMVTDIFANALARKSEEDEVRRLSVLALAQRDELLRTIISSSPIILFSTDINGVVTLAEGRTFENFGSSPDEMVGKSIYGFCRQCPALIDNITSTLRGVKRVFEVEFGNKSLDIRLCPLRDENQMMIGLVGIGIDVTDRREADKELRTRNQALQECGNGIEILDASDHSFPVVYVNPAYERMTGFSAAEVVGKTSRFFLNSDQHNTKAIDFAMDAVYAGTACRVTFRHDQKTGGAFTDELSIAPVRDASGKITHVVIVHNDVTDVIQLQEQLHHSHKMESIGQLAAGIAHELNTPIQFVGDNLRFIQDNEAQFAKFFGFIFNSIKPDNQIEFEAWKELCRAQTLACDIEYLLAEGPLAISQSLEGVRRVSQIVRAMKEFSHPGAIGKEPCEVAHNIRNTIDVCRNEWKYVAEIETQFEADLPPVTCLASEINQAVLNLIVNAAHAIGDVVKDTNEKGVIRISTHKVGEFVEIRVLDTGKGIPEEVRARVFDPFFTTKEVGKGTGQGLAIVHSIICEHHGGHIHVESCVGEGTTFILQIPISPFEKNLSAAA